jgi:hypothetical protein
MTRVRRKSRRPSLSGQDLNFIFMYRIDIIDNVAHNIIRLFVVIIIVDNVISI